MTAPLSELLSAFGWYPQWSGVGCNVPGPDTGIGVNDLQSFRYTRFRPFTLGPDVASIGRAQGSPS